MTGSVVRNPVVNHQVGWRRALARPKMGGVGSRRHGGGVARSPADRWARLSYRGATTWRSGS